MWLSASAGVLEHKPLGQEFGCLIYLLCSCLFQFLSSVHMSPSHIFNAFTIFSSIDVLASRGLILMVWLPLKAPPLPLCLSALTFLLSRHMRVIALERGWFLPCVFLASSWPALTHIDSEGPAWDPPPFLNIPSLSDALRGSRSVLCCLWLLEQCHPLKRAETCLSVDWFLFLHFFQFFSLFLLEVFLGFLKAYVEKFSYKSVTTDDWKDFLYSHFKDKVGFKFLFSVPSIALETIC